MYFLINENYKDFSDICARKFGRKVLYSNAQSITAENVAGELAKVLHIFGQNRREIHYLYNYYLGNQPILYRKKAVRPEITNKVVENHAFEIVEFKTSQNYGEGITYARIGDNEAISDEIVQLNGYMRAENKDSLDIRLGRWQSIAGTAYRFVYMDKEKNEYDEAPFGIDVLDPRDCAVVYSSIQDGYPPLFAFLERENQDGELMHIVYTKNQCFEIVNNDVVRASINGIGYIPIVEYPNNDARISDIETTMNMTDAINKMQSNRIDGMEQFVQAFMKFINCDVDEEKIQQFQELGAIVLKTTGDGRAADVDLITAELDQTQSQVSKDDMYESLLTVQGMPSRQQNTGGDTGQAVYLRNGWDFAEQRAKINEPIRRKAEREFLKIILHILEIKGKSKLKISDVDIKMPRSQMDNMTVKVNALTMLIQLGIDPQIAIKTVSLWSDSDEVYVRSKDSIEKILNLDDDDKEDESAENVLPIAGEDGSMEQQANEDTGAGSAGSTDPTLNLNKQTGKAGNK